MAEKLTQCITEFAHAENCSINLNKSFVIMNDFTHLAAIGAKLNREASFLSMILLDN